MNGNLVSYIVDATDEAADEIIWNPEGGRNTAVGKSVC
jgi:hypothetical protein